MRRRVRCALVAVAAVVVAGGAWAPRAHADVVRYDVVVDAPAEVRDVVEQNLGLARWRDADGKRGRIDEDQLRRLFDQGRDEIERLVATEGYYAPTVTADLANDGSRWIARYTIAPNAVTTVGSVDIAFAGAIADAPVEQRPAVDELRRAWSLREGAVFRQGDWEQAKRALLRALLIRTYPFATITRSEAKVDVRTNRAALTVVVASGPVVRFGALEISGLERYPPDVVRNLTPIRLGDVYSQDQIFEYQRRLNGTGFFARVDVSIDAAADPGTDPRAVATAPKAADGATPVTAEAPPPPREVTLPLRVAVEENKSKQVSVGLGYSTNAGPRATAGYNVIDFLGGAKQLRTTASVDQLKRSLGADLLWPQTAAGVRYSISANVRREDVQNEVTRGGGLSGRRVWGPEATERFRSIDYLYERKSIADVAPATTQTLGVTEGVTLRRTDNLLVPTSGYLATAQAGAGARVQTGEPFVRLYGKGLRYVPLGASNTLLLRIEGGAIGGPSIETMPSTLVFRAGGLGSVRGYGYQSLGVRRGDAIVGGRYLATGSVEGIHWLGPRWPDWGVALFVDAGNAGNQLSSLRPVYGYGTGARWRSPVGVLDVDVARGVENGSTRIHFALGVSF